MSNLSDITGEIIEILQSFSLFDGFTITKAFTPEILETEPEKGIITVSVGEAEYTGAALGQGKQRGKLTVNISVYLPFCLGYNSGDVEEIVTNIVICLLSSAVCAVKFSPATADSATRCLLGNCSLTLTSLLTGGVNDG